MFIQGSSTGSRSICEPQGYDMDVDEMTAHHLKGQIPPSPLPCFSPICLNSAILNSNDPPSTTSNPTPASYKTKLVIYPTRYGTRKSLAGDQIGWGNFIILVDKFTQVKKLEGLALFKPTKSKKASNQVPHEFLMSWILSHTPRPAITSSSKCVTSSWVELTGP